jgi:hypothetical protein
MPAKITLWDEFTRLVGRAIYLIGVLLVLTASYIVIKYLIKWAGMI